jgi:hypothetical protein
LGLAGVFVGGELEGKLAGVGDVREAKRGAIVDDPIGARSEKGGVVGGAANGKNASASGFAGTYAGRSILDDDAILSGEMESGGAFCVGLGIGFAVTNVGGADEVMDVVPKARGAEADFGKCARGGSDDGELAGSSGGEQVFGSGKGGHVGDVFDFGALHPIIFGEMDGSVGVGEEFANGGEAGAAVGELDGGVRIEIVLEGPARPNAGDRGSGVDENAIHVDEEASTGDLDHEVILAVNGGRRGVLHVEFPVCPRD